MKKLISLIAALSFAMSLSFSVQAINAAGATQAGPLVTCTFADGSTDYLPSMICTNDGGTFMQP